MLARCAASVIAGGQQEQSSSTCSEGTLAKQHMVQHTGCNPPYVYVHQDIRSLSVGVAQTSGTIRELLRQTLQTAANLQTTYIGALLVQMQL